MSDWLEGRVAGRARLDRRAPLDRGRGARPRVHGGPVRPARAAGAARREGADGRPALLVREPAGRAAARVLPRHRAGRTALAAARGARSGRSAVARAARERLLHASPTCPRPRRCGASRPAPASVRSSRSCAAPSPGRASSASCSCRPCGRPSDLAYAEVVAGIARAHPGAFRHVPVVSREAAPGALRGRIPALIDDGRLEARGRRAADGGERARDAVRKSGDGRRRAGDAGDGGGC